MHNSLLLYCTCTFQGQPRLDLGTDGTDVKALQCMNYGWTKIASLLNISHSTLY